MFDTARKHTISIEGRGTVTLGPGDYVASGGEGHVYRPSSGSVAIKIWEDSSRVISGRMVERIKALSVLKSDMIASPEALVRSDKGDLIGYAMPWAKGADLPLAFTNDWRGNTKFGDAQALEFVNRMRDCVSYAHSHDIVLGDANELNILVSEIGKNPVYIDVDPWIPRGFSGDSIMPSVQDMHSPLFTKEADWFAWGIVSFQVLVGVHPYKGYHPDFKRGDEEGRKKANVSVFNRKVELNKAVRPFSLIPKPLRSWYESTFQSSSRVIPPEVNTVATASITQPAILTAKIVGKLTISKAFGMPAEFMRVIAPDRILCSDGTVLSLPDGRKAGVVEGGESFTMLDNGSSLMRVSVDDRKVVFGVVNMLHTALLSWAGINAYQVWEASGRLFAVVDGGIVELQAREIGMKQMLLTGRKWPLNPNSTVFGGGAAVYDALGAKHLVVPQAGQAVAILRVKELDGMKPVSILAKGKTVIMTVIDRAGAYRRASFWLSDNLASYTAEFAPVSDGSLSDVVLDSGVVLWIDSKGDLGVRAGSTIATHKLGLGSGVRLLASSSGVFCAVGKDMFRLSLSA